MICIGIDTSGPYCAAALWRDGALAASGFEPMQRGQAERMMGLAHEVLAQADLQWADLNRIGVGIGPGNFTGIRISVAAARGLALGLGIPAIGVSQFEVIRHLQGAEITPAVPAPREQIYIDTPCAAPRLLARAQAQTPLTFMPEGVNPAKAIAQIAAMTEPEPNTRPAPLYIKPADAAPPRDAPPRIIP